MRRTKTTAGGGPDEARAVRQVHDSASRSRRWSPSSCSSPRRFRSRRSWRRSSAPCS